MASHLAGSGRPPPPLASAHRARTGRLHELGPRDFSPTRPHRTRDRVRAARPPLHPAGRKLPRFRRTPRRAGRGGGVAGSAANRGAAAYKPSPHWLFGQGAGLGAGGLPERPGGRSVGRPGCGTDPLAVGSRRAPQRGVRPASRRAW